MSELYPNWRERGASGPKTAVPQGIATVFSYVFIHLLPRNFSCACY